MTNDPVEFIDLKHGGVLVEKLIKSSYETFDLHFVGKLVHLDGHVHILELFLSAVNISKNYFKQKVYSSKSTLSMWVVLLHGTLKGLNRNVIQVDGIVSALCGLCKVAEEHGLENTAGHRQNQLVALELL
jgi:hypothetical protein